MAQALIIDDSAQAAINGLREHAEANQIDLAEMKRIMRGRAQRIGDRPGFLITVPIGVSIAYSIEQHPEKWFRHASVSVNGKLPSPHMMEELIKLLGFNSPMSHCIIYMEQGNRAMNVLEPADGALLPSGVFVA